MAECDATFDINPDGVLFCTREVDHPGQHLGAVWWMLRAPHLEYIQIGGDDA